MAIFAHPDDEVFGSGGTLARYAEAGERVVLVCATRGEGGKVTDPELGEVDDVGALRERELHAACDALGIEPPVLLDFHDSGRNERTRHDDPKALMNVDMWELERALLPQLERFQPDLLLSHDPHGTYGHIDHLKVHRAAEAAFWSARKVQAAPPRRLYQTAISSTRMAEMQAAREGGPLGGLDPELFGVGESDFAAVIDIAPWAERKRQAISAHRSQVGPASSFSGMTSDDEASLWRAMFERETFTLGGVRGPFSGGPLDDLFAE
jgi:N-acetyl-1-D-myo-inositol-2-amino-2-deoxy-alpha-D-glucopyranoside deacetylase